MPPSMEEGYTLCVAPMTGREQEAWGVQRLWVGHVLYATVGFMSKGLEIERHTDRQRHGHP